MKNLIALFIVSTFFLNATAQKFYSTKSCQIKFNAGMGSENLKAITQEAESRWLENNGQIIFSLVLERLRFENPSSGAAFKSAYLESDKFPKTEIKGFINDIEHIDLGSPGANQISIDAVVNFHGISQKMQIPAILTVLSSGKMMFKSDFKIKLNDFKISGKDIGVKIAPEASIDIYCIYE
ncbi:MAG: YceI family protein [Chitinophagaceae bacterium]|nr:YceI family protein [Chitinophagaceae bacterium]